MPRCINNNPIFGFCWETNTRARTKGERKCQHEWDVKGLFAVAENLQNASYFPSYKLLTLLLSIARLITIQ